MPSVSVITPCYNREPYIGRTIESVLNQTFTDWEYILVDDGSQDNSAQVMATYADQDDRIQLIQQPNGGVCKARNHGFQHCSPESQYVIWLDSDDVMAPDMLATMVAYLEQHPQVGLLFCNHFLIDEQDRFLGTGKVDRYEDSPWGVRKIPPHIPQTPFVAVGVYCILEPTAMLRKTIYTQTSGWPEWLGQIGEGIYLFTQIALLSEVHFLPQALYYYRQHSQQAMVSAPHERQWQRLQQKWKEQDDCYSHHYQQLIWFFNNRYRPYLWLSTGVAPRKLLLIKAVVIYLRSFWQQWSYPKVIAD